MKNNKCIRALADINQINSCKKILTEMNYQIIHLAALICLAGNGVRLKILYIINKEKKLCVCDLSDILDMNIAAISQHLKKLKDGGLLKNEKMGQTIFYSLNEKNIDVLNPLFKQFNEVKSEQL
jgi:DNA-binding transcriptional ArsR family regulator